MPPVLSEADDDESEDGDVSTKKAPQDSKEGGHAAYGSLGAASHGIPNESSADASVNALQSPGAPKAATGGRVAAEGRNSGNSISGTNGIPVLTWIDSASTAHAIESLLADAFGSRPEPMPRPHPGHGRKKASQRKSTAQGTQDTHGRGTGGASKRNSVATFPARSKAQPGNNYGGQGEGDGEGGGEDTFCSGYRLARLPRGPLILPASSVGLSPALRVARDMPTDAR